MNAQTRPPKSESGFMLLEALLAILIFSLGILALVALQAKSIQLASDAKYRTNATLLANQLIGEMWVSGLSGSALKSAFETGGASYNTWKSKVSDFSSSEGLPGVEAEASGITETLPTVSVTNTGVVTITLFWRTPEMKKDIAGHQHVVVSQIVRN